MKRLRFFLGLVISSIFALASNIIANGLDQKYNLVKNHNRWLLIIIIFVVTFLLLLWIEYKNGFNDSVERPIINRLKTRFGSKTGNIRIKSVGQIPKGGDLNTIDLGPMTETKDIEITQSDHENAS